MIWDADQREYVIEHPQTTEPNLRYRPRPCKNPSGPSIGVITLCQHARKGLGESLRRYARLRVPIDLIDVVSKVAWQMRLVGRSTAFIAQRESL